MNTPVNVMDDGHRPETSQRYLALDVFRGFTIALMVLVNTPGDWSVRYSALQHAAWHGFTITDLVFPAFLFAIGNAMSFSMRKAEGLSHRLFFQKVLIRFVTIYGIGLGLSLWPVLLREGLSFSAGHLSEVSFTGVLQRIAVTYLLAAVFLRFLSVRVLVGAVLVILFGYWGVLYFFGDPGEAYSYGGNAVLKFDVWLYARDVSGGEISFNSEALLSSVSATVNILLGYLAGVFIQFSGNRLITVVKMGGVGVAFILLGQVWDYGFPINKALWTSSYGVYSTGWILVILSVFIWVLECAKIRKWAQPFEAFGKNPLFIYIVSDALQELLYAIPVGDRALQQVVYQACFTSWLGDYPASLAFAVGFVGLMWVLAYGMDKRNMYIKV